MCVTLGVSHRMKVGGFVIMNVNYFLPIIDTRIVKYFCELSIIDIIFFSFSLGILIVILIALIFVSPNKETVMPVHMLVIKFKVFIYIYRIFLS